MFKLFALRQAQRDNHLDFRCDWSRPSHFFSSATDETFDLKLTGIGVTEIKITPFPFISGLTYVQFEMTGRPERFPNLSLAARLNPLIFQISTTLLMAVVSTKKASTTQCESPIINY